MLSIIEIFLKNGFLRFEATRCFLLLVGYIKDQDQSDVNVAEILLLYSCMKTCKLLIFENKTKIKNNKNNKNKINKK